MKHPGGRPKKPASERATAVVHVRVTAARKAAYVAAAKARGMSFSQWVQEWLDCGEENDTGYVAMMERRAKAILDSH